MDTKICIRCHGPAESILYQLCDTCREGDILAELLTDPLVQSARVIRQEMKDSIQTVQIEKAERALLYYTDEIMLVKECKTRLPKNAKLWTMWLQGNAAYYLNQARMFLNTEYTG